MFEVANKKNTATATPPAIKPKGLSFGEARICYGSDKPAQLREESVNDDGEVGADTSKSVVQMEKRIVGFRDSLQTGLVGINLMPSGGFWELFPGNGRGYGSLSSKIAGHSSVISGSAASTDGPMVLKKGIGFSPASGFLYWRPLFVGLCGFWGKAPKVAGSYHSESQSILDDKRSNQLLVHVTPATQERWEEAMPDDGGGVYTFAPESAKMENFQGSGSDNCTTIAFKEAIKICEMLIGGRGIPIMDKNNLLILKYELEVIIGIIVEKNKPKKTTYGTQGRAMGAFEKHKPKYKAPSEYKDLDNNDGFGLFLPPSERW